ncbi:MAG: ATP-binding protein [Clostridia bacterium]|nr:ATP-binding protein [Clostridia bacterium]
MLSGLLFILWLLSAEIMLTYSLKRAKLYPLRLFGFIAAITLIVAVVPYLDYGWYTTLIYFVFFILTIVGLRFCYEEAWSTILFRCIAAYATQHLAYQYCNLVFTIILGGESPLLGIYHNTEIGFDSEIILWVIVMLMSYLTIYMLMWFLFARKIKSYDNFSRHFSSFMILISGCLILNIVLNTVILYSGQSLNVANSIVWYISSMFNCVLLLRWQYELMTSGRLQNELDLTNRILKQAETQYAISKENIDLINIKCHDMKHHIREIGQYKQLDPETIAELEHSISVYDARVKTDNEALDVILTEKSRKCVQNGIILDCIADGKALEFMKNVDIYSLFGNVLDNALEAVMKIEEQEKRVISLKVYKVNEFVSVSVKNYYNGELLMRKDGLPDTTKGNKDIHGYGMSSIKLIVDRYGGDLSVSAKDGVFMLNILFHKDTLQAV